VADLVGKRLKDFYVLRRLGRGAMAEVYLAQQVSLDRHVALKVLNADLAPEPNYVRRFHHEARAAAALVHGGIVQIYEVGQEDGVHFIAQEYVAGRNLGEIIRSSGSLSPGLTLDILQQVAAALYKASTHSIVHRDVKPENIMLARSGEVKVTDFGLARVQGDGGANLTQIGVTMGTPLYMSPEQIEGRELDSRSDIYSLGVTAYHMLAGTPPFTGDSPLAVAMQHLNQTARPLSDWRRDVPAQLARVVERMIAKKPGERFDDPAALAGELHGVATDAAREGWAAVPDNWSLTRMIQTADQRADATSRLDRLMKSTSAARPRLQSRRWIAVAAIGCVLLGAALAALSQPRSLLDGVQAGPPTQDTAWQQIYHAKTVDTEEAWEAVLNRSDATQYQKSLARQGLVYRYLTRAQSYVSFEKALAHLQQLASSAQRSFQVFGIAGLVVAYAGLNEDEEAYKANQRLTAEDQALLLEQAPRMAELRETAIDELLSRAP
jgi:eukaryotic-like serine/threonine-protein kinase